MKDVSANFVSGIENVQKKFNSDIKIRILEFSENSGSNYEANRIFNYFINSEKHVFYTHIFSNRDCCVFFIYSNYKIVDMQRFNNRTIPHEFAHHFQFVQGFPCLLPKGVPIEGYPEFADVKTIGPKVGEVLIDGLLLKHGLLSFFKDFSERISDFICESILIEKGFTEGYIEEYRELNKNDLTKTIPKSIPEYTCAIRYMRRLMLRDEAEWQQILNRIYPNNPQVNNELAYNLRKLLKQNNELPQRKQAFKKMLDIISKTEYTAFKEIKPALNYIKQMARLLNIEIKTDEKW